MTTTTSRLPFFILAAMLSIASAQSQGTVNLTNVIFIPPRPPRTNIWIPTPTLAAVHFSNRVPEATPPIDAPIFNVDGVTPLEGNGSLWGPWPPSTLPSDNFVAQIYAGRSADSLSPMGSPTTFGTRAGLNAGYVREQHSRPIIIAPQPPPVPIPYPPVLTASVYQVSAASEAMTSQLISPGYWPPSPPIYWPPIYWPPIYNFPTFTVLIPVVEPGEVAQVQVRAWDYSAGSTYEEAVTYGGKHGASAILPIVTGGGTNPPAYLTGLESFHVVQGPPVSPVIVAGPSNQTGIASQDIYFNVFARGTPPLRYQWYFNGYAMASQTNALLWLPGFSAANVGQYQVRVSNHAGSIDSLPAALDLRVVKPPVIVVPPRHRSVWIGREAVFRVVARGTQPLSYQWYHGGGAVPDGTNATLRLTNVQPDVGDYWVSVSNEAGSVQSAPAQLAVLDPSERGPKILRQPQDQTVRAGRSAFFWVAAAGAGRLRYQWRFGDDIPNARDPIFFLKQARWSDSGYYYVVVSNDVGETLSVPVWLGVLDPSQLPPEIVSQPEGQVVLTGTPIKLRVRAGGTRPLTYQWYFNDVLLPGETASTLRIDSAYPEHAGTYRVIVENPLGGVSSLAAGVNVLRPKPQPLVYHGVRSTITGPSTNNTNLMDRGHSRR